MVFIGPERIGDIGDIHATCFSEPAQVRPPSERPRKRSRLRGSTKIQHGVRKTRFHLRRANRGISAGRPALSVYRRSTLLPCRRSGGCAFPRPQKRRGTYAKEKPNCHKDQRRRREKTHKSSKKDDPASRSTTSRPRPPRRDNLSHKTGALSRETSGISAQARSTVVARTRSFTRGSSTPCTGPAARSTRRPSVRAAGNAGSP